MHSRPAAIRLLPRIVAAIAYIRKFVPYFIPQMPEWKRLPSRSQLVHRTPLQRTSSGILVADLVS